MSRTVTSSPARIGQAALQRKCACGQRTIASGECEECKKKETTLQRHPDGSAGAITIPPVVREVLGSPGQPLDRKTCTFFEPRFGHDFSQVRVHTDSRAAKSADAVHASAYTVGKHIVFSANQYSPHSASGQSLLAHELTHVIQQRGAPVSSNAPLTIGPPDDNFEARARETSASIAEGRTPAPSGSMDLSSLQRDEAPIEKEKASVVPRLRLDLDSLALALDVTKGQHKFSGEASLSEPLNLFGVTFPGIDNSQFLADIQYQNRCNRAFQSALIQLQQDQRQGGSVFDFKHGPWRVGTQVGFRLGSIRYEPGGTLGFEGNRLDSLVLTLKIATGVSDKIPKECLAPPAPAKPPEKPKTPDVPKDKPGPGPDIPKRPGDIGTPPSPEKPELQPMTLYFYYDTAVLREESNRTYELLKQSLAILPSVQIILTGHTSLEGTEKYNKKLGQSRADAIRQALVVGGIAATRIQTISAGEEAPAVLEPPEPKHTFGDKLERLRDLNRRVEVVFFDPSGRYAPTVPEFKLSVPAAGRPKLKP